MTVATETASETTPPEPAPRPGLDIGNAELVRGDDATHWVVEDRPDTYQERLAEFLLT